MKMTTKILNITAIALIFSLVIISCNKDGNETLINETDLCLVEIDGIFQEVELDKAPEFLNGGNEIFTIDILRQTNYPAEARENGIEGICLVNYEITTIGTVENIEVTQDPGGGIGTDAKTAIESVTQGVVFSPGILNGNPVRVKKEMQIRYKLE